MTKKKDAQPNDGTKYTLRYRTATFVGSEDLDTPTAVRDRLDELRAEGLLLTEVRVTRDEEDDISAEFQ